MKRRLLHEEGQSAIIVIITLVVLLGLIALVLDIGNAYAQRRIAQNAADAGAMAAGRNWPKDRSPRRTTKCWQRPKSSLRGTASNRRS